MDIIFRVDVKDLKLYQQLFVYFVPIVSNLGFINILVVVVRLLWFEKRLKEIGRYFHELVLGCSMFTLADAINFNSTWCP